MIEREARERACELLREAEKARQRPWHEHGPKEIVGVAEVLMAVAREERERCARVRVPGPEPTMFGAERRAWERAVKAMRAAVRKGGGKT